MKAVICPICQGDGVVGYGLPCHGCECKGWVEVHEEFHCSYPIPLTTLYPYATVTISPEPNTC